MTWSNLTGLLRRVSGFIRKQMSEAASKAHGLLLFSLSSFAVLIFLCPPKAAGARTLHVLPAVPSRIASGPHIFHGVRDRVDTMQTNEPRRRSAQTSPDHAWPPSGPATERDNKKINDFQARLAISNAINIETNKHRHSIRRQASTGLGEEPSQSSSPRRRVPPHAPCPSRPSAIAIIREMSLAVSGGVRSRHSWRVRGSQNKRETTRKGGMVREKRKRTAVHFADDKLSSPLDARSR